MLYEGQLQHTHSPIDIGLVVKGGIVESEAVCIL